MTSSICNEVYFTNFIITDGLREGQKKALIQSRIVAINRHCLNFIPEDWVFVFQFAKDFPNVFKFKERANNVFYRHYFIEILLEHLENKRHEFRDLLRFIGHDIHIIVFDEKSQSFLKVIILEEDCSYRLTSDFILE